MNVRWTKRLEGFGGLGSARRQGFRGVRLPVGAVMAFDEAAYADERERVLAEGLSFEAFDSPLPPGVQVTERGFNLYAWTEYLAAAVERIAGLGCRVLVWGDGRSRLLPLEGEAAPHKEQFYQFLFMLCGIAERYGITVCVEPLSSRRTNFINTPAEAVECFSLVGRPNLALAIGLRDLRESGADPSSLSEFKGRIAHLQVENPGRPLESLAPRPSDGFDYSPFFRAVRSLDYEGALSLPPDADAEVLAYCAGLLEAAG